ncbi:LysR substrate-binding domain-containing protein [Schlegelella sp. S2-27]|uniref:LysR substrate-binding domain-containing protein n=1 Tax=Caldimonas mangrovi TaxID=2944811 RepID=A0ABT0YMS6_9BURK|nr:LysR substrate-binding domain-containing protein [Caldimonas mangrovi]MCM5679562.1 LysR substrate-binding domain-containing protein [Caldimonas mangrovi]
MQAVEGALMWLVPRLGAFNQVHPGIQLRVKAEFHHLEAEAMRRERTHLAIRYDVAAYPGFDTVALMDEWLLPVGSPDFFARHPPDELLQRSDGRRILNDASPWDGAPPYVEWTRVPARARYMLLSLPDTPRSPAAQVFAEWLREQCAREGRHDAPALS